MTRKEALEELIAKVEAGEVCRPNRKAKWQDCDFEKRGYGYRVNANIAGAYNGSLGAAKALHEAVFPGWDWRVGSCGPSEVIINRPYGGAVEYSGDSSCPARAWLLAILRALLAQEPSE